MKRVGSGGLLIHSMLIHSIAASLSFGYDWEPMGVLWQRIPAAVAFLIAVISFLLTVALFSFLNGRYRARWLQQAASEVDKSDGGTGRIQYVGHISKALEQNTLPCSECGEESHVGTGEGAVFVSANVSAARHSGIGCFCPRCRQAFCSVHANWKAQLGVVVPGLPAEAKFFIAYCLRCGTKTTGRPEPVNGPPEDQPAKPGNRS